MLVKTMDGKLLSQRLISLRSLVADHAESNRILKEVDIIIGISKQEQQEQILSLKAECKSLRQKVKRQTDQEEALAHTKENLESDLEILTIKCENLQAKLKAINQKNAKEARKMQKQSKVETKHYEIQVEIISQKMVEDLSKCYRREFEENQALRRQARQHEMQAENEKMSQTFQETLASETNSSEEVQDIFEQVTEGSNEAEVLQWLTLSGESPSKF